MLQDGEWVQVWLAYRMDGSTVLADPTRNGLLNFIDWYDQINSRPH